MSPTRLPRFQRAPANVRLELTERDRVIHRQVQRHRFLRSSHVIKLLGGSRQPILRRLQRLYHAGHLERLREQLDYFSRSGSRAIVYGLGRKGTNLLKPQSKGARHTPNWLGKNPDVGRLFLEHALLTADVMVALEIACRRAGQVRLLTGDDLSIPGRDPGKGEPFRWDVRLNSGIKLGVVPDAVFALEFTAAGTTKTTRTLYFLEADRGTMPVVRHSLARSSIHRRMMAYEATSSQGVHRTRFGFNRFRVLTVTSSRARMKTTLEACRTLERGQGLFLFTDAKSLRTAPDLLALSRESARDDVPESLTGTAPRPRCSSENREGEPP